MSSRQRASASVGASPRASPSTYTRISGCVAADVGAGGEPRRLGVAGRGALQQRARLRVGGAEGLEVVGQRGRQHHQIRLHVARGQAGGCRIPRAIAARRPHRRAGFEPFGHRHAAPAVRRKRSTISRRRTSICAFTSIECPSTMAVFDRVMPSTAPAATRRSIQRVSVGLRRAACPAPSQGPA